MAGQNGQNKNTNDGLYAIAGFIAIICVVLWLFWTKNRKTIIYLIYGVDYIQYFIYDLVTRLLPFISTDHSKWMHYIYKVLTGVYNPKTVSFQELIKTQADIGNRTWFVFCAICGFFAWKVRKNMLGDGLKRTFSLIGGKGKSSFIEYQSRYWTEAKFAVGFNPEKCDAKLKPPKKPIPWLLENKITLTKEDGLNKNLLEKLFIKQVGPKWTGYQKAPFFIKAFLTMCMTTLQHAEKVDKYRSKLNTAFYNRKLTDEQIEEAVLAVVKEMTDSDPKMIPEIDRIIGEKHAFMRTGCLGIIGWCGPFKNWGGGYGQIISPAMYQWLLKYDRTLFMALQSHGKFGICSYIEGSGIISHYLLERTSGCKVEDIYVTSAVNGVEELLEERKIIDFEDMQKSWESIERRY